jgi:hypothetical protein
MSTNGGAPGAVACKLQRLHPGPGKPKGLDVRDETAIRGWAQDLAAGGQYNVNHARDLVLRDRNHPAVVRWSQSGPYAGTNSYSDVAGNTATLSFVGTRVTLHVVTAPNHGIAAVSIDGGAETVVDEYSRVRTGDVSGWTSPPLGAGTHTVRVRVTGSNRAGATDNWVTVDRFETGGPVVAGTRARTSTATAASR